MRMSMVRETIPRWILMGPLLAIASFSEVVFSAPPAVRPGYGVPPERVAEFEALREKAKVPLRRNSEFMPDQNGTRFYLEADLVRYEDGVVVVAEELDRKSVERLRRLGVVTVTRLEDLRDGVIFDDRLYRVLTVSPTKNECQSCSEGHLVGPDAVLLTRRVGLRVRLELAANETGRFLVVGVTTPKE